MACFCHLPGRGLSTHSLLWLRAREGIEHSFPVFATRTAPDTRHQTVVSNLLFLLRLFLREHPIARALTAPTDVLLPGLTEPVQPDLLMVKNERRDLFKKRYVEGSPDLVIEVLSPSNWLNDRRVKYAAYAEAGVAEYWIVDPQQETVEVFALRDGSYELLGESSSGEQVRSETLSGFEPAVDEIFGEG